MHHLYRNKSATETSHLGEASTRYVCRCKYAMWDAVREMMQKKKARKPPGHTSGADRELCFEKGGTMFPKYNPEYPQGQAEDL